MVRGLLRLRRCRVTKRRRGVRTRRRGRPLARHRVRSPPGRARVPSLSDCFVQQVVRGAPDEPRRGLHIRHGRVDDAFAGLQSTAPDISRDVADLARDLASFGELLICSSVNAALSAADNPLAAASAVFERPCLTTGAAASAPALTIGAAASTPDLTIGAARPKSLGSRGPRPLRNHRSHARSAAVHGSDLGAGARAHATESTAASLICNAMTKTLTVCAAARYAAPRLESRSLQESAVLVVRVAGMTSSPRWILARPDTLTKLTAKESLCVARSR